MYYMTKILLVLFIIANMFGCRTENIRLPRQSFVKVKAEWKVQHCKEDIEWEEGEGCTSVEYHTAASGAIVAQDLIQTYILTAGHVCDTAALTDLIHNAPPTKLEYRVQDANGIYHTARVYKLDTENDICILQTTKLTFPIIQIRKSGPKYGEKLYNLAAPAGFANKNYVPVVEGRYSGFTADRMVFTIPAVGGSSGSPIFDKDGEMVGIIISIHIRAPFLSFSPHYDAIKKIINEI